MFTMIRHAPLPTTPAPAGAFVRACGGLER